MNISGGKFVRERERELGTVNGSPSGLQQIRDGNEITGEGVDERVSRTMEYGRYDERNGLFTEQWDAFLALEHCRMGILISSYRSIARDYSENPGKISYETN